MLGLEREAEKRGKKLGKRRQEEEYRRLLRKEDKE
jgi:hypothetical protein